MRVETCQSRRAVRLATASVLSLALNSALVACTQPRGGNETGSPPTTANPPSGTTQDPATSETGRLDVPPLPDIPAGDGCDAVDILFVIDNSASMGTFQQALADAFPSFVDQIFDTLPAGISVHVGITTTDFWCTPSSCECAESTLSCQTAAPLDDVLAHYSPPTEGSNGSNGGQGRLFTHEEQSFFDATTDDDPAELAAWFSGAAVSAGEQGCSFEMPVAAAGYVAHPSNAATNADFIRDEGAVLLVFFLTDEPDKSPEPTSDYHDVLAASKAVCGGDACIIAGGLVPACIADINQKAWQFLNAFGGQPVWSDINDVSRYPSVVGDALSVAVADLCETIVPAG